MSGVTEPKKECEHHYVAEVGTYSIRQGYQWIYCTICGDRKEVEWDEANNSPIGGWKL